MFDKEKIFFSVALRPNLRFLYHTQRRATAGRTPLDKRSARRRDLYLKTHNTHNRRTSFPRRDSKPQYEQARDRRTTLQTARPLRTARTNTIFFNSYFRLLLLCPYALISVQSYWACTDPDAFSFLINKSVQLCHRLYQVRDFLCLKDPE